MMFSEISPAVVGSVPALAVAPDDIDNVIVDLTVRSDLNQDQIHLNEYRLSRGHARRLARLLLEAEEIVGELQQVSSLLPIWPTVATILTAQDDDPDWRGFRPVLVEILDGDGATHEDDSTHE